MSDIPKISLRDVKKSFGSKHVLAGIDLDIPAGESMVIIGGSGTGKSVLLKCVLGLMKPDSGDILIDGQSVAKANRDEFLARLACYSRAAHYLTAYPFGAMYRFACLER